MSPLSRSTPAGAAYLDLRRRAQRERRPTQELLHLYVLECFLARLAASGNPDFVLKGGVLLAAWGNRRPTQDVDLAGLRLANDPGSVLGRVRAVLAARLPGEDGVEFHPAAATAETIREDEEYSGVRVHADARLATARIGFHVDVNVGDPIWPRPTTVELPRLLGGDPIRLPGYPLHMVHAEKITTAVQRGTANTRWRDYADIWTLSRQHPVGGADIQQAIGEVARHRGAVLAPLGEVLDGYTEMAQGKWFAWRRRTGAGHLPGQFAEVLADVLAFADPPLDGKVGGRIWDPGQRAWR